MHVQKLIVLFLRKGLTMKLTSLELAMWNCLATVSQRWHYQHVPPWQALKLNLKNMYVCMYVCMHVCMYACMYVFTCVCLYVYYCMQVLEDEEEDVGSSGNSLFKLH